jgi:hypothetical protein
VTDNGLTLSGPYADQFSMTALGSTLVLESLFAGLAGRYVARDIFVDGNTWRDSHSVSRTPFVSDQMLGLGIHWNHLEIRVTMTRRTDQYRSQAAATRFGSVVFVWKP